MAEATIHFGGSGSELVTAHQGFARRETMFAAYAGIVLTAMLFGLPSQAVDMLLIFTACLVGGLVLVVLAARKFEELASFPMLVVGASCLHLAATVAAVRSVTLNDGQAGRMIALVASRMADLSGALSAVVFLAMALVSLAAVAAAARHVNVHAVLNLASLDRSRSAGYADADAIIRFNTGILWASRYLVLGAVISAVLLCIAVLGAGTMGAMTAIVSGAETMNHISAAVAAGLATLLPATILAAATAGLMSRDFMICKVPIEASARTTIQVQKSDSSVSSPAAIEAVFDAPSSTQAQHEYQRIARLLLTGPAGKAQVVLLAAASSLDMGVTVPVNVAAILARKKQRCLIIDIDASREAVARAFEIRDKNGPVGTGIPGLWVWAAGSFCRNSSPILKKLEAARKHFDRIIVYRPCAAAGHDELIQAAGAAVLYGRHGEEMAALEAGLAERGCVILR